MRCNKFEVSKRAHDTPAIICISYDIIKLTFKCTNVKIPVQQELVQALLRFRHWPMA